MQQCNMWRKDNKTNYAGAMVQELLRILGESHRLTRAGLHLLLQPHLTELSLRSCAGLVSNAITQLVTVRCQFLWSLDLHSCQRVPAPTLAVLLEGLPRLVKLCLSDTQCDTRVLSAVGSCCPRLRELDISHCKKLTPPSLLHLAYDPTQGTFCCPALRVLLAQDVMQPGPPEQWVHALCFLLLALPSLEQLSNASLPSALRLLCTHQLSEGGSSPSGFPQLAEVARAKISLAKVGKEPADGYRCQSKLGMGPAVEGGCRKEEGGTHQAEDGEGKAGRALRLRRLEDMEEVDLPLVGSLCQGVEEAAISLGDQVGPSWGIVQWPRLTHLTLHCPGPPVRSLEEVLTSLESTGSRLRFLSLQNLLWGQEGSLRTLLSLCPNLRTFQSHLTPRCRSVPRHAPEAELPPWGEELVPLPLPHLRSFSLLMDGGDPMHPVFEHTLGGSLVSLLCGCGCLNVGGVGSPG
ncbi:uncharacterized protein LOC142473244 isoform X2 [Ascaphus truei]|uniref:uncharacterized protein LOC142473244 isoform X2 n=1 Tax=Ascaphus truei TaxID=8439 RepID=UPI003F5A184F